MALFQLIEDLEEGQKIKAGAQINQEDKVGLSLYWASGWGCSGMIQWCHDCGSIWTKEDELFQKSEQLMTAQLNCYCNIGNAASL